MDVVVLVTRTSLIETVSFSIATDPRCTRLERMTQVGVDTSLARRKAVVGQRKFVGWLGRYIRTRASYRRQTNQGRGDKDDPQLGGDSHTQDYRLR